MRSLVVFVSAAGCLLALAGCGGAGTTSSAAGPNSVGAALYSRSVCTSLAAWKQHLQSASAVLMRRTNDPAMSLPNVRAQFVTFYGGAIAETDRMLVAVGELGVPDVNEGPRVAASLKTSLRRFRTLLVEATARARRLPVGDEVRFTKQAQGLGTGFEMELAGLPRLWEFLAERYKAPRLAAAANAQPACRTL